MFKVERQGLFFGRDDCVEFVDFGLGEVVGLLVLEQVVKVTVGIVVKLMANHDLCMEFI
jgi:hypothetical protein